MTLQLDLPQPVRMRDLCSGEVIAESIDSGLHEMDLRGQRARLIHLKPE